jgi:hypothetical protein
MTVITNALIVSKITKLYLKNVLKKAALPDNTKNTENASPIPLDVKPSTISEIAPSAPPASTTTTMTVSAPAPEELSWTQPTKPAIMSATNVRHLTPQLEPAHPASAQNKLLTTESVPLAEPVNSSIKIRNVLMLTAIVNNSKRLKEIAPNALRDTKKTLMENATNALRDTYKTLMENATNALRDTYKTIKENATNALGDTKKTLKKNA